MKEQKTEAKFNLDEKSIEKDALENYNEKYSSKVQPQNQHHNARKESFGQSQQERYR